MAREYDAQLLESVAVRRNRLRESLLWGRERRARATMDNLKRLTVSVVLAAVACAGCVGWSFLQDLLAEREQQQQNPLPAPVTATR
jgi:type VI protein secretion system component VasF